MNRKLSKSLILKEAGKGLTVREIIAKHGGSFSTFKKWRDEDPEFDLQLTKVIDERQKIRAARPEITKQRQKKVRELKKQFAESEDPKEKFLLKFRETYQLSLAAIEADVLVSEVEAWIDPEHHEYDGVFEAEFREIMALQRWVLRDRAVADAMDGKASALRMATDNLLGWGQKIQVNEPERILPDDRLKSEGRDLLRGLLSEQPQRVN